MASRSTEPGGSQVSMSDWSAYTTVSSLVCAVAAPGRASARAESRATARARLRTMATSFVEARRMSRHDGGPVGLQKCHILAREREACQTRGRRAAEVDKVAQRRP